MSAATCPVCRQFLRTIKPPQHMEGQVPDRMAFHRTRPNGPICPGAGQNVPLHPEPGEAS